MTSRRAANAQSLFGAGSEEVPPSLSLPLKGGGDAGAGTSLMLPPPLRGRAAAGGSNIRRLCKDVMCSALSAPPRDNGFMRQSRSGGVEERSPFHGDPRSSACHIAW